MKGDFRRERQKESAQLKPSTAEGSVGGALVQEWVAPDQEHATFE